MLKSFFEYILELGNTRREQIGEQIYTTQQIHRVPAPTPDALTVRNLSGLVDYVKENFDQQPPMLIHVESPTSVVVYSTYNRDMRRNELIRAAAMLPEIPFKRFLGVEEFNVLLQSCFVANDHRAALLAVVGNIKEENVATFGDNGTSQQVTAKTGVATLSNVVLPNPVSLKPYRSFVEIKQPESQFVFRMQNGPSAALYEADGGAWKLDAIEDIKKYLFAQLSSEIEQGKATIIA